LVRTGVNDALLQGIDGLRAAVIGTVVRVLAVFADSVAACIWALAQSFIAFAAVSENLTVFFALARGTFNVLATLSRARIWSRPWARGGPA